MKQAKSKLYVTVCILILCATLLISATFAWLTLSRAPETIGIETNIGSNGGIEIALLSTETYRNLGLITTKLGDSAELGGAERSNLSWGNVIDLTAESYGLSEIPLLPARLNLSPEADGSFGVGSSYLQVPEYSIDGRITKLVSGTVSGPYSNEGFRFSAEGQQYGVRGIGLAGTLTAQQAAIAAAKTYLPASGAFASNAAISALNQYGSDYAELLRRHYQGGETVFTDEDLRSLRELTLLADSALDYVEQGLRHGLIAGAASRIYSEEEFSEIQATCENPAILLSDILLVLGEQSAMTDAYSDWIYTLESSREKVALSLEWLDSLSGGAYSWESLQKIMDNLIAPDLIFADGGSVRDWSELSMDTVLTLAPGSGVFADIADFTGNYRTFVNDHGKNIEYLTQTLQRPANLLLLSSAVQMLQAANGSAGAEAEIEDVFGFAMDLAFRTNAANNALLLRTEAAQRVSSGETEPELQGGGSFMVFSAPRPDFSIDAIVGVMDAVRIGFVDAKGTLLGIAKLNTSNYEADSEGVKAYLYLYDSTLSENGVLQMGERQEKDAKITALAQNVPTAITVIVWLDGDEVDNSMAVFSRGVTLTGKLNLQFCSAVDLVPAKYSLSGT